jgi:IS5 family transposase
MVDATIVPVPKQRNSRDENDDVKAGKTPEAWEKNPAKNRQKDKDARWTKKHGKSLQEPRECGCQAQADSAVRRDRRECA